MIHAARPVRIAFCDDGRERPPQNMRATSGALQLLRTARQSLPGRSDGTPLAR